MDFRLSVIITVCLMLANDSCQATSTGASCITSCEGRADGDYQTCQGCNMYASCVGGLIYDRRPCAPTPGDILRWDDNLKRCEYESSTCGDACVGLADSHVDEKLDELCKDDVLGCATDMQKALVAGGMSASDVERMLSFSEAPGLFQTSYCSAIGTFDVKPTLECMNKATRHCLMKLNNCTAMDHDHDKDHVMDRKDMGGKSGKMGDMDGDHQVDGFSTLFKYMCHSKCANLTTLAANIEKCVMTTVMTTARKEIFKRTNVEANCKMVADETGKCMKAINCCPLVKARMMEDADIKGSCTMMQKKMMEACPKDDDDDAVKKTMDGDRDNKSGATSRLAMPSVVATFFMVAFAMAGF